MQPGHIYDLFKHTQIEDQKEVYKCINTVIITHMTDTTTLNFYTKQ